MADQVVLHVGLMKSGTTYLQAVLGANRKRLAAFGIHYPGPVWARQKSAVADFREMPDAVEGAWDDLAAEVRQTPGVVVISVEHLAVLSRRNIERLRRDLGDAPIRIIVTARDLGRTIPAMWQESIKNGSTLRWGQYLDAVRSRDDADTGFWRRQSYGSIAAKWGRALGAENVRVVVVPPPGAPRDLLWERFCDAADLPATIDPTHRQRANESLGVVSMELMRRVNEAVGSLPRLRYRQLVKPLGKLYLPRRRDREPRFGFRPKPWVVARAERQNEILRYNGIRIVGGLDELAPTFTRGVRPGRVDLSLELEAALEVITGLSAEPADIDRPDTGDVEQDLDLAVKRIVDLLSQDALSGLREDFLTRRV